MYREVIRPKFSGASLFPSLACVRQQYGGTSMASILDLARMNDSGDLAGNITEHAIAIGPNAMALTAVRTTAAQLRLITWRINSAGPVTPLGDSADLGGRATEIDIARGARFVVLCRNATGRVTLISWDVDDTGAFITRVADSGDQAGGATLLRLTAMSDNLFV